jgi:hypothetical protein
MSALFLILNLFGCADVNGTGATEPSRRSDSANHLREIMADPDRAAAEFTRALAIALNDHNLQKRLVASMGSEGVTAEHKLDLSRYIDGETGQVLVRAMAEKTGYSRDDLIAVLRALPPLEFYMPVPSHRAAWDGNGVIVALQLNEAELPVGFDEHGAAVRLSLDAPPTIPTLVLTPVETPFAQLAPASEQSLQVRRPSLTLLNPPPDTTGDGGGGTGVPLPYPDGVYFDKMTLYDVHEPWTKGSPEIEVHIIGQQRGKVTEFTTMPQGYFNCPSGIPCSYYDQNTVALNGANTWLFYEPNARTPHPFDCAGMNGAGRKSFNYESTGTYYHTILFADQANFVTSDLLITPTGPLARRNIPYEPPFEIRVIERDDGGDCPDPIRQRELKFSVEINKITGTWTDYQAIDGLGVEDVSWLWGANNDMVASWVIPSYSALEQANGLLLDHSVALLDQDADLRIVNMGFSQAALPPYEEYHQ